MSTLVVKKDVLLAPAGKLLPECVEITHSGALGTEPRRGRRSRWDGVPSASGVPAEQTGAAAEIAASLSAAQSAAYVLRVRLEEITRTIVDNANAVATGAPLPHAGGGRTRSPSPPPTYDHAGRRTNTRELRLRERLLRERAGLVQQARALCPALRLPPEYVAPQKRQIKIYLPEDEFPQHNFIGMIIGPRGSTQRRMEKESGAKISLRGRGATKEGQLKRTADTAENDEPLHLIITADTDEQLNMAYNMVKPLLMPLAEDVKEEYRRAQLTELAIMNGTIPRAQQLVTQSHHALTAAGAAYGTGAAAAGLAAPYDAGIVCGICGDHGHPDADCPFRGLDPADVPRARKKARIEDAFESFMAEIGETPAAKKDREVDRAMDAFLAEIGATEKEAAASAATATATSQSAASSTQGQAPQAPGLSLALPDVLPAAPPPPGMAMPDVLPAAPPPPGTVPVMPPGAAPYFGMPFGFAAPQQPQQQPPPPPPTVPYAFQQQQQPPPPPPPPPV